jgi:hypothetical protein
MIHMAACPLRSSSWDLFTATIKGGFLLKFLNTFFATSAAPQIPLSEDMPGLNPGLLALEVRRSIQLGYRSHSQNNNVNILHFRGGALVKGLRLY